MDGSSKGIEQLTAWSLWNLQPSNKLSHIFVNYRYTITMKSERNLLPQESIYSDTRSTASNHCFDFVEISVQMWRRINAIWCLVLLIANTEFWSPLHLSSSDKWFPHPFRIPGRYNDHICWKMLPIGDLHNIAYCYLFSQGQEYSSMEKKNKEFACLEC